MSKNYNKFDCLLFPDPIISEKGLKAILTIFEGVHMPRPWYLEYPPEIEKLAQSYESVSFIAPPQELNPGPHFPKILEDCQTWIGTNPRGGYGSFLKAALQLGQDQEMKWEIRDLIKNISTQDSDTEKSDSVFAHVIVHLYSELNRNLQSAEETLESLKDFQNPLQEALGEEPNPSGPVDDLEMRLETAPLDDETISDVLKAWFYLFGTIVPGYQFLVTQDKDIVVFLTKVFEEASAPPNILSATGLQSLTVEIPDMSFCSLDQIIKIKKDLEQVLKQFLTYLLRDLSGESENCIAQANDLENKISQTVENACQEPISSNIKFTLKKFPPLVAKELRGNEHLSCLSNKVIFYFE